MVTRLPDDVTADVLRRLVPRWLAASRCVCKAWRAVVDTRRLLRADLLPLSLDVYVWILNETYCDDGGESEWMLKGKYSLDPVRALNPRDYGPWILQDNNSNFYRDLLPNTNNSKALLEEERFEWNSDSDSNGNDDDFDPDKTVTTLAEASSGHHHEFIDIELLGFHPYKEIMFMSRSKDYKRMAIGLAYHLNSSKVEALGSIYPTHYGKFDIGLGNEDRSIYYSFPYTPCWVGDLS